LAALVRKRGTVVLQIIIKMKRKQIGNVNIKKIPKNIISSRFSGSVFLL
jgi:hypothetical protein